MTVLPSMLVAIYTFHYGRWAAKQRLRRGAAGLYLLAAATVAVPAFTVWWTA
ncbi:MAG: hypothetical protein K0R39_1061 [Symbiobacteriaceae bacterium]|jgi:hypothetical protein|nr:hypothetical protein [Symbiobacteriaceae bacterium]